MELNFKLPFPPDFFSKRQTLADEEPVTHTPIIITDGSASIEFDADLYQLKPGTNKHPSKDLYLNSVEARDKHTQVSHNCYPLAANEEYRIEVTCTQGGSTKVIFIRGANRATGGSPEIEFDHGSFPRVTTAGSKRHRHFNDTFSITRMEIFQIVSGSPDKSVHICPLVPGDGKCEITINDPHAEE
jgi:hypothetical protein